MRIIAGQWRSRLLAVPRHAATRPMTDRVREAVFDILGSCYGMPGELPPITVADAFAGSGSLGLEALSRGAECCCFFESAGEAYRVLKENLVSLQAGPNAYLIRRDVWAKGLRTPNAPAGFDLIFLDPPYRDSHDPSTEGAVHGLVLRGNRDAVWAPGALIVLHHEVKVHYADPLGETWGAVDRREYGSTAITFFRQEPV